MKMTKYVIKRIILMFFVFFVVTTICFTLIRLLPGSCPRIRCRPRRSQTGGMP